MASAYLTRTFGSAGNRQSWTWSGWIKKSKVYNSSDSGYREVWFGGYTASNNTDWLEFGTQGDVLYATSQSINTLSTQVLRDVHGWYHAVVNYNGNNLKFYINGELWKDSTDFSGNLGINVGGTHTIGALATNQSSRRFTGLMSHVHFVDGAVLAPTSFGESDSNGVWKPKPSPSVTYGTNGYFLKMDNSGNMGLDSGGGSNNFTTSGTITQAKDTPSNVFATLNPLATSTTSGSFSNGNTTHAKSNSTWASTTSTLAASSGKYYAEYKFTVNSSSSNGQMAAIVNMDLTNYMNENSDLEQNGNKGITYYANGTVFADNQQTVATYGSYTNNIIQIAMDLDNGFLYFGKDGVWQNSANPASGATGTGGINISSYLGTGTFAFGLANRNTGSTSVNFGNGYFGTTAVTSAGANASDNGIFEYDVPTGYTALSTKGLNS